MTTGFSRSSTQSRRRRSCSPRLEALEVRWTLSQTLPADGTILVANTPFVNPSAPAGVVEVNPTTGAQSVLSSGGLFSEPLDLREAPNDTLYVADYNAHTSGAVIAVDPSTGAQSLVASGGHIDGPFAIQYMKGHLFVADSGTVLNTTPNVVEIDPSTGKQTLITQGGNLPLVPSSLELQPGPGNTIYVGEYSATSTGAILRVDLHTGAQTLIATGGYLNGPVDMALNSSGNLIVGDTAGGGAPGLGNVVSINPQTGSQTLISAGGLISNVNGSSVDRVGDIFVSRYATSSPSTPASIIEVNPSTGAQSIVSTGGYLDFASGQVVFYHSEGAGSLATPAAATSGAAAVAGDSGIALAVALVTHGKQGLHAALADPSW